MKNDLAEAITDVDLDQMITGAGVPDSLVTQTFFDSCLFRVALAHFVLRAPKTNIVSLISQALGAGFMTGLLAQQRLEDEAVRRFLENHYGGGGES